MTCRTPIEVNRQDSAAIRRSENGHSAAKVPALSRTELRTLAFRMIVLMATETLAACPWTGCSRRRTLERMSYVVAPVRRSNP
jgi:hypothetical protein